MMRKLTFLIAFLFSLNCLFGQERTITGTVLDETGQPMIGATVTVKGTQKGTVTDIDGKFSISAPATGTLQFSFVGYTTLEQELGADNVVNITMKPDVTQVEDVVVVGYGVQKKALNTGSIAKVDAKDLTAAPVTRVEQALQGKVSGVNISTSSGSPGGKMDIVIRGAGGYSNTEPLVIVDGVKTNIYAFQNIPSSDVADVQILKDAASSSIYGADAGNGVILVTTKSGAGKKGTSEISYSFYSGVQSVAKKMELMDAKEYLEYKLEGKINDLGLKDSDPNKQKKIQAAIDKYIANGGDTLDTNYAGTDWQDELFQTAMKTEHVLTFSGSDEKNSYYFSASYLDQDGIIGGPKNNFNRLAFRFNGDSKLNDWMKVGTKLTYSHTKKKNVNENNEFGGVLSNAYLYSPMNKITESSDSGSRMWKIAQRPWNVNYTDPATHKPVTGKIKLDSLLWKDANGDYYSTSFFPVNEIINPVAQLNNTYGTTEEDKFIGTTYFDFEPIKGLVYHSQIGMELANVLNNDYSPLAYHNPSNLEARFDNVFKGYDKYFRYNYDNYVTYSKTLGDHSFSAMAGMAYSVDKHENLGARRYGIQKADDPNWRYLNSGTKDTVTTAYGAPDPDRRMISYFTRVNYNYKEKYLLTFSLRRDGATELSKGNKFQNFPAISLGWVVSSEPWWFIKPVNSFKLKASWGRNGNKRALGSNFEYVSLMEQIRYPTSDGAYMLARGATNLSNPDLTWETNEEIDFGADMGFFGNRITLSVNRYVKTTIDQIVDGDAPNYAGNLPPKINKGEVQNSGWEFDISHRKNEGAFKYYVTVTAAYLNNEVISYGKNQQRIEVNYGTSGGCTIYRQGWPVRGFYGFKTAGIFKDSADLASYGFNKIKWNAGKNKYDTTFVKYQPAAKIGDVKYVDLNSPQDSLGNYVYRPDSIINDNDKTLIGNPYPEWTFGLNLGCEAFGFDFNMFWSAEQNKSILKGYFRGDLKEFSNLPKEFYDNRWTPKNTNATLPRSTATDPNSNFKINDLFIQDGSYIKLKSVSLGYTFPQKLTKYAKIQKLRVYVSGENLLTITDYEGSDPDVGFGGGALGLDKGLYPSARTYVFGVNVTF